MQKVYVQQLRNRKGNPVKHHFVVDVPADAATYLQSYETIVVKKSWSGLVTLDPKWDSSRTTARHVVEFLYASSAVQVRLRLKNGIYKQENLN